MTLDAHTQEISNPKWVRQVLANLEKLRVEEPSDLKELGQEGLVEVQEGLPVRVYARGRAWFVRFG